MTGAEHYAEAERLVDIAASVDDLRPPFAPEWLAATIACAQVHATLALAASTVTAGSCDSVVAEAWERAIA